MTSRDGTGASPPPQPVTGSQSGGATAPDRSPATPDEGPIELDFIDEALEETMIASDPPALTPETRIGPPDREPDVGHDQSRRD